MNNGYYRNLAIDYQKEGDNNKAIEYFLMAIDNGDALACIDMAVEVKYPDLRYKYTKDSIKAINSNKLEYYLDLGIAMGSLDCMFYKARELVFGDYLVKNNEEAYKLLIYLQQQEYDTDYLDDDYTVDDYIDIINKEKE